MKLAGLAMSGVAVFSWCAGCGPRDISASDQKAMEAKYNQQSYEEAMIKAGRGKELEEQKRLDAERRAASQDR